MTIEDGAEVDFDLFVAISRLPNLRLLSCKLKQDDRFDSFDGELPFAKLKDLRLKVTQENIGVLRSVLETAQLEILKLRGEIELSDELTAKFENQQKLRWLTIDGINDAALGKICKAKSLESLNLNSGRLTKKSLAVFAAHPSLRWVQAPSKGISSKEINSIIREQRR